MNKQELLKKYHAIYGDDCPVPPDHLLPVIVEMIESGQMEKILKTHGEDIIKLGNQLGMDRLDKDDPAWIPPKQNE